MNNIAYVAYLRVSTQRQGASGLGLQAQQDIIRNYLKGEVPIAEFVEVESGRKTQRPKIAVKRQDSPPIASQESYHFYIRVISNQRQMSCGLLSSQ